MVSDVKGTTTDPVMKSMELLPMGPVVIIDTPGFDDEGAGRAAGEKDKAGPQPGGLRRAGGGRHPGQDPADQELIALFQQKDIPYLVAYNKSDLAAAPPLEENELAVSAVTREGIEELKERVARLTRSPSEGSAWWGTCLPPGTWWCWSPPLTAAAPKGRLILPQQQTLRDVLDAGCLSLVVKEDGLRDALQKLAVKPRMVITDSQAFPRWTGTRQGHPPDLLLHPDGPVQGLSHGRCQGRGCH